MNPWRATLWILAALLFWPHTAQARWHGRCGHGQILRVSMGRCVSIGSSLARAFVRLSPAPHHHRLRHGRCDPLTQCGDPIEDEVTDETPHQSGGATPPQKGGATPRDEAPDTATPRSELPDAFTRSTMRSQQRPQWRVQ